MFRKFLGFMAGIVIAALVIGCGSTSTSTPDDSVYVPTPSATLVNLAGHWTQVKGFNGVTMVADIYTDSIQINMTMGNMTSIFWLGSFNVGYGDNPQTKPIETNSLPDPDAVHESIFGSSEKIKTFSYDDGILSFDFSMMGVHSTVELTRSAT